MASSSTEQLPAGVQWLTSDVVEIEGVPSGTTYAMEMSFDDGINTVLDHPPDAGSRCRFLYRQNGHHGPVSTWENAALDIDVAGAWPKPVLPIP